MGWMEFEVRKGGIDLDIGVGMGWVGFEAYLLLRLEILK